MPRAVHTGEILANATGLEPKTVRAIAESLPSMPDPAPPNWTEFPRETVELHRKRLDKILERITKRARGSDKHLVLACHGNVTRYLWCRAWGRDPLAWWELAIHNGSRSRFEVRPNGKIRGIAFNDIGHLPAALQTEA